MNAYDITSPSDLLIAFLEGDLLEIHEDLLFSHLSGNPSLRLEMREMIAVNRLSTEDAESLRPPSAWKSAVMAGVQDIQSEQVGESPRRVIAFPWYRAGGLVLAALLIGVLGTLGTIYLLQDSVPRDVHSATFMNSENVGEHTGAAEKQMGRLSDESVSSEAGAGRSALARSAPSSGPVGVAHRTGEEIYTPESSGREGLQVVEASDVRFESAITEDADAVNALNALNKSSVLLVKNDFDVAEPAPIARLNTNMSQPVTPDLFVQPEYVEVGYRNTIGATYPNVVLPSELDQPNITDAGINGASLSLLYRLEEHHQVGVEMGRDVFPQVYRGVENGEQVRYEQKPTLFWAGAAYQYRTGGVLFDGVHPFVRVVAGGTDVGPLLKGVSGIQFIPEKRVALTLGVEGSALLYQHQKTWFTSRSLDFTYGLSISF